MLDSGFGAGALHQAAGLAALRLGPASAGTRVLAIVSGAKDVGCTTVAMQLARAVAHLGGRPLVLDEVAPECALALGAGQPRRDGRTLELADVLEGTATLCDVIARESGVRLVAAARGLGMLGADGAELFHALASLSEAPTLILVHAASAESAWAVVGESGGVLVVTGADPVALQSTYAMFKRCAPVQPVRVVVNRTTPREGESALSMLRKVSQQFLGVRVESAACIPDAAAMRTGAGAVPRVFARLAESIEQWALPVLAPLRRSA